VLTMNFQQLPLPSDTWDRLRIWGSGVRISSGAPFNFLCNDQFTIGAQPPQAEGSDSSGAVFAAPILRHQKELTNWFDSEKEMYGLLPRQRAFAVPLKETCGAQASGL
jgi:hypothetical protein